MLGKNLKYGSLLKRKPLRKKLLSPQEEVQQKDGGFNMASDLHTQIPKIIDNLLKLDQKGKLKRLKQKIKIDDPYSSSYIHYKPDYVIEVNPTDYTEYFIIFEVISEQDGDKTAHDLLKILGKRTIRKAIFISTSAEKKRETDNILNVHLGQLKKKFGSRTKKDLQDISSIEIKKEDPLEKIESLIYDELVPFLPKTKSLDVCQFCGKDIPKNQILCKKCDNGKFNTLKGCLRRMINPAICTKVDD